MNAIAIELAICQVCERSFETRNGCCVRCLRKIARRERNAFTKIGVHASFYVVIETNKKTHRVRALTWQGGLHAVRNMRWRLALQNEHVILVRTEREQVL